MEIIGIICEYNPFHNGHIYHINKIKEKYPDSIIILCLNGYFCQRGDISILTKEDKTHIALENKINLVVELPCLYGVQGADIFATASIKILNKLNVNRIIFGSESNDITYLENIAKKQLNNDYSNTIKKYLDTGLNYPSALNKALNINLKSPNDLLGVSYIKAILNNNYDIKYECIKRTSNYLDTTSNDDIVSASNLREKIKNNINIDKYINYNYNFKTIDNNLLFNILKYKIITDNNLNKYLDVDEGLEYKITKEINNCNNIEELILKIKSKRYTYNKLKRMFIHILLGITKENKLTDINYIKILGFDNQGQQYLKKLNKDYISTKISEDNIERKYELISSKIYDILTNSNTYEFEIKNKPIIYSNKKEH